MHTYTNLEDAAARELRSPAPCTRSRILHSSAARSRAGLGSEARGFQRITGNSRLFWKHPTQTLKKIKYSGGEINGFDSRYDPELFTGARGESEKLGAREQLQRTYKLPRSRGKEAQPRAVQKPGQQRRRGATRQWCKVRDCEEKTPWIHLRWQKQFNWISMQHQIRAWFQWNTECGYY